MTSFTLHAQPRLGLRAGCARGWTRSTRHGCSPRSTRCFPPRTADGRSALLTHPAASRRWGILDAKLAGARVTATAAGPAATEFRLGGQPVGAAGPRRRRRRPRGHLARRRVRGRRPDRDPDTWRSDLHPRVVAGAGAECPTAGGIDTGSLQLTPGSDAREINSPTATRQRASRRAGDRSSGRSPPPTRSTPSPIPAPVDVHYGSLAHPWPAYDCSGSASYVLWTEPGCTACGPTYSTGRLRPGGRPGPASGSPCTPTRPTPGSWSPGSRLTPPTTAATRRPGCPQDPGRGGGPTQPATSPTASRYVVRHPAGAWNEPS